MVLSLTSAGAGCGLKPEAPRRAPSYLRPMDAMEQLRSKIPRFPGYLDEGARRLSDELVRAYAGEAIAGLMGRLGPLEPGLQERFDGLLMRAGFTNQVAFKAYENADLSAEQLAAMASADQSVIALADRAETIELQGAPGYLDEAAAALDARDAAMLHVAA
ncbi:MAG: hypothetical protein ACYDGM_09870 [Vulcanimicrobiaceae bacterium]